MMASTTDRAAEVWRNYRAMAVVTGLAALGFLLLFWHDVLVPAKMTFDSQTIQSIARGTFAVGPDDKSYANIGSLYRWLGLAEHPSVAAVLGFTCFFALLAAVVLGLAGTRFPPIALGLLVASTALGGIFLGQYSKDVLVALLALLAFSLGRRNSADLLFVAGGLLYATLFRQYWFLVIAYYVVLRFSISKTRRISILIAECVFFLAGLSLIFPVLAHVDIQSFRETANIGRVGSDDAQTMIVPLVAGSSALASILNTVGTFFELLLPLPMFLMGVQHAAYGMFLVAIWAAFFWGLRGVSGHRSWKPSVRWQRCVALCLAVVSVQAIFEPDYGSYLRHLTPLLPLIVYSAAAPLRLRRSGRNTFGGEPQ